MKGDELMTRKWRKTAAGMSELREHYLSVRKSKSVSVHKTLFRRALPMLCALVPEAEKFYQPITDIILSNVCRPDKAGDYEKGTGRHYYCVTNAYGMRKIPSEGYYRNGIRKFAKSARSMFDEDYTMALTMYKAGYIDESAVYFARAIHMLSDMCCLPHVAGMTYFSNKSAIHKAYEALARAMYPDALPERTITVESLHRFDPEKGFGDAINDIAEEQIDDLKEIADDPVKSITNRLYKAEEAVAALLYRFMADVSCESAVNGYIPDNSCIYGHDIRIEVTDEGLHLLQNGTQISVTADKSRSCSFFRAAHRFDGLYTFSPVSDANSKSLILTSGKLCPFNPNRRNQLYKIVPPEQK